MLKHPRLTLHSNTLYSILIIGFVYTLHAALPVYISSSFLSQYVGDRYVGIVYMMGAVATIAGFLSMSHLLVKLGNKISSLWLVCAQLLLFWGIITTEIPWVISLLFIIQTAIIAMMSINIDVFVESFSDIQHIGRTRGLLLTITNIAWICAPLVSGIVVDGDHYKRVFILAFGLLFLLFYLFNRNFNHFRDPHYPHTSIHHTLKHILAQRDLTKVFIANIILQTFYAWMVIYLPIYLHEIIGFNWSEIGLIFTVMLIPFIITQLPLGRLADKRLGEKEIMTAGFAILAVSTYILTFITSHNAVIWAIALFTTRIGASAVEIMIETYFFKKINPRESNVLSIFRITRPLAYIIAPALSAIGILYLSYNSFFILIGLLCASALYFTLTIRDTN